MAQHGGKREGAGRPKGQVSEAKRQISEEAKEHGQAALNALLDVMANPEEPASARVSAANAILDRGYGKPQQTVDNTSSDGSMTPKPAIDAKKLSDGAMAEILNASPDED
jgi:hypothetical protein